MPDLTDEEIRNRVTYHAPSAAGVDRHGKLSAAFAVLMAIVDETCPSGRDKSVVFTHLETAKMWASAAVARNPETR